MLDAAAATAANPTESNLFIKYKSSYALAFNDLYLHLCFMYMAIYFMYDLRNSYLCYITSLGLGLLLHRTFIIFHDCCHNSYSPNTSINYIIATFFGIFTFTSPNWILDHHIHHKTNGNIENKYNFKFNELLYYNLDQYKKFDFWSKTAFEFFHTPIVFFSVFPVLYFGIIQRIIYIIKKIQYQHKIEASFTYIICNHFINNIGLGILLYFMYKNEILFQFLLSSYIGMLCNFLMFFNQHTFNPPYIVGNNEWTQRNSGLYGSSFIQVPDCLTYFTMGIEYHHIHHINAKIPGYNLQKYHSEAETTIFDKVIKLSMYDCYHNLWLMLYDNKNKKYITINQAKRESS